MSKNTRLVSYDEACDILWQYEKVYEQIIDQSRWYTYIEYVIKDDIGDYWQFVLEKGSTEYQETYEDNIELTRVEPYEATITKWRVVKDET